MTVIFTGDAYTKEWKQKFYNVLLPNELGGNSPYELLWAGTSNSGYTFGVCQNDVAGNTNALNALRDILINAKDENGNYIVEDNNIETNREDDEEVNKLMNLADDKGGSSLSTTQKNTINLALQSTYGMQRVDETDDTQLGILLEHVDEVINSIADDNDKNFLNSPIPKLFLADFRNQYGDTANDNLVLFLHGFSVVPNTGGLSVQKDGALGVDDLLRFYFSTGYAQSITGLRDHLRRFHTVVSVAGGFNISDDENAKDLIRVYQDFLKSKKNQIISLSNYSKQIYNNFDNSVLSPARTKLINSYVNDKGISIDINGEVVVGKKGDEEDTLEGTDKNDLILGEEGNDTLKGKDGDDFITGEDGDDLIFGGKDNDTLEGGLDQDYIYGEDGHDTLIGGEGNDYLYGGDGYDQYYAGNGDIISDSDQKGRVLFEGTELIGGIKEEGNDYWEGNGGKYYLDGTTLTFEKGSSVVTILNYNIDYSSLGIHLEEEDTEEDAFSSPLVLDLNNNGALSVTEYDSPAYFDLDGDGFREKTGWVESEDGLLALDKDESGTIDNGNELFGSYTKDENGNYFDNGFAALSAYDINEDGIINASDDIYSSLNVWIDANQDGISQEDELHTLESLHIDSINLNAQEIDDSEGLNQITHEATFVQQQTDEEGNELTDEQGDPLTQEKAVKDVWFYRRSVDTIYEFNQEIPSEVLALPDMKGAGRVKNLAHAMTEDSELIPHVETLLANSTASLQTLQNNADALLARWTHTEDISPAQTRGKQLILNHNYQDISQSCTVL